MRKLRHAARTAQRTLPAHLPPVFVLTDPARSADVVHLAGKIPRGWGLIYRHYGEEGREDTTRQLRAIARRRRFALLIAADPKLARKIGAAGVHWPERLAPKARIWRTRFAIMTTASHSRAATARAANQGLSAVLRSTVFPSESPTAGQPIGALKYRSQRHRARIAHYALGGVFADNAGQLAGIGGLAGVSGLIVA